MRCFSTLVQQAVWAAVAGFTFWQPLVSQAAPGDLDLSFSQSPLPLGGAPDGLAMQPDGKMVLVGGFGPIPRNTTNNRYIARLDGSAGAQDTSFVATMGFGPAPRIVRAQRDGKLMVGGEFELINGVTMTGVARLNADGTLDTSFANPTFTGIFQIFSIIVQPDGKVIVGGYFSTVGGVTRNHLVRLNADGSVDTSFNPNPNSDITSLALLPDGKIVVVGGFNQIAGSTNFSRIGIAILNSDGTLDPTPLPHISPARCVAVQGDGKIVVGGSFGRVNNQKFYGLLRLNTDRTLDMAFRPTFSLLPNTNTSTVRTLAIQADGKMIVGGNFRAVGVDAAQVDVNGDYLLNPDGSFVGSTPRVRAALINADGSLDAAFNPSFHTTAAPYLNDSFNFHGVIGAALQPNGKIMLSGYFSDVGNVAAASLVRFENTVAVEKLSFTSSRIEWLRGGSAPEATQVLFDQSTDGGTTWTLLGSASRITGGWELTGLSLPSSAKIRASAITNSGVNNGSGGVVQIIEDFPLVPPAIVVEQPTSTPLSSGSSTIDFGNVVTGFSSSTLTFTVRNTGSGLLKRLQVGIDGAQLSDFALTAPTVNEIAAGGSTTLSIIFTPSAKLVRNATLRISSNDTTTPLFSVALTGTGIASPNADLAGIGLPLPMTLSPTFAANTLSYTADAVFNRRSITITPTAQNAISGITINGTSVTSGSPSASINLTTGANVFTLVVTAENGINTKTYTLTVTRATTPLPGELDYGFDPFANAEVLTAAQQTDGKVLIGGRFVYGGANITEAGSLNRPGLGRINPNGSFDSFNPLVFGGQVSAFQLLPSGQILASGTFAPWSGTGNVLTHSIVLINADGSREATFDPVSDAQTSQMALASGGKILIVGDFTSLQPNGPASATTRNRVARLNANGTLDTAFNPNVNGIVRCVVVQPNGMAIIGGTFTMVGSTARSHLARITTTGAVDATFTAASEVDFGVNCLALQPDGKVFVGGNFSNGGLVRLNTNGSLDSTFTPPASSAGRTPFTLALQENGKIIVAGNGGLLRSAVERLNADGSMDTTFAGVSAMEGSNPGWVNSLSIQDNGLIVIAGRFASVNGISRTNIARIDGATPQSLVQLSGSLLEWSRGGQPPAVSTAFDFSTDSGATWTVIDAAGTFVDGVWQGTITTPLPTAGGLLRGRAIIAGGQYGEMIYQTSFSPPAPKIDVEQPVNDDLADGDAIDLGTLGLNVLVPAVVTIRNAGGQNLTLSNVTITGTNANQFSIIDQPALTVAPLESTTFTVHARVTTAGLKTATLNIASNDTTATPFNIVVNATGAPAVLPVATTLAATGLDFDGTAVNAMRATLNGTVDANGQPREVSFEYGPTTAYGTTVTLPGTFNSANPEPVTTQLTGLAPHTTYHYRVRIDGDLGNAIGVNRTFTTVNRAPVAGDDTASALASAATTIAVLDNDSDADGDTLTISTRTAVTPSTAGTVAIVSNQLVFTASAAFGTAPNLTATFGYRISDGEGSTDDGTVTVSPGSAILGETTKSIAAEGTAFETPSSYPVTIQTSGSWAVTEALTWATVSPLSGRDDGAVNITVQPNTTTAQRVGVIRIGGVSHTITQSGTVKPTLGPLTNTAYQAIVGGYFELVIPTVNAPVTYTTTGMPPGLTLSNTTGMITGRPTMTGTAPTTYNVTVRASNASGPLATDTAGRAAATVSFTINVIPLPPGVVGTFHGLIERSSTVNVGSIPNLGARWEMTVSPLGAVSGKIIEGVTTRSFADQLEVTAATANSPTVSAVVTGTALTLDLKLDAVTDSLSTGVGENVLRSAGNSSVVTGWGNAWSTTAPIKRATQFRGPYSFAITNPATTNATNTAAPDGFGFGSFIVSETNGALRITGDLPDGSKILCDTFIGQNGQLLLYTPLHGNKGSIHGQLTVTPVNAPTDNTVVGPITWLKPTLLVTDKDKSYQSGFGPLTLDADGSTYLPPARGQRVLGLPAPAAVPTTATNAKLAFTLGGLDLATPNSLAFNQLIRVSNPSTTGLTNTATVVPFNATTLTNPNKVAITSFTAATGAFAGNFTLPGTPARVGPFAGQIVRIIDVNTTTQGYGYFLLPTGVPNVTTSPKLSGRVELSPP